MVVLGNSGCGVDNALNKTLKHAFEFLVFQLSVYVGSYYGGGDCDCCENYNTLDMS